jgi:uncharacterized membrane protein required for colicin V production
MTALDWVLVVVWAGITLGGFFKGAIRIVFGLGGVALGLWLSVVTGPDLAKSLTGLVNSEWLVLGLAHLLPLIVVVLLCLLAGWGMEKTLEALKLGCVNRLLGAALAGTAAGVVLAVLLVTAVRLSPELAAIEERSVLLAHVRTAMGWAGQEQDAENPELEAGDPEERDIDAPDPEDQGAEAPAATDEAEAPEGDSIGR